jgi:TetR/AcrR family transcriptional regulator, transcriptional repressor for nem operon
MRTRPLRPGRILRSSSFNNVMNVILLSMAALAQEVARSTPEIKAALEQGFEKIPSLRGGDRKEANFRAASMIGGVVLACAVQDPRLSDEILKSVRQKLG